MRRALLFALAVCLLLLLSLPRTSAQCACTGCTDTATLTVGETKTFSYTCTRPLGYAIIETWHVASTDNTGFDTKIYNPANATSDAYNNWDGTNDACLQLNHWLGMEGYSSIAIDVTCVTSTGCNLEYEVSYGCAWKTDCALAGLDCGSHGTCNGQTATCTCSPGYNGRTCSTVDLCYGVSCGSHGSCDSSTGTCTCTGGFIGSDCSTDPCADVECGSHGSCTSPSGTCACSENWAGTSCDSCAAGRAGSDCSTVVDLCLDVVCGSHGSCSSDTGTCTCTDGYTGTYCLTSPECNGHGTIDSITGFCVCDWPYTAAVENSQHDCLGNLCGQYGTPSTDFNPAITYEIIDGVRLNSTSNSINKCTCTESSITIFTRPENCVDDATCQPCRDAVCSLPVVWPAGTTNWGYATVSGYASNICNCPVLGDTDDPSVCKIWIPCGDGGPGHYAFGVVETADGLVSKCYCADGYTDGEYQACSVPPAETCSVDSDCSSGEICQTGVCIAGCTTDADCESRQLCSSGHCDWVECKEESDCMTSGQMCFGYHCVSNTTTSGGSQGSQGSSHTHSSGADRSSTADFRWLFLAIAAIFVFGTSK